jgi:HAD superfamily hydrolase (TIGR01509 family)
MIRGLIFDFDGLLVDTETPIFTVWEEVFREYGGTLTLAAWSEFIGRSPCTFDPYALLEETVGRPVAREEIENRRRPAEAALVEREGILPGVSEAIEEARTLGLQLAVASSSSRQWVLRHLKRIGLAPAFAAVRCSDDVMETKPAPDLYLAALDALSLDPEEAIAFEDSPRGAAAARSAGIYCVVIPNGLTRSLPFEDADRILPSLDGVSIAALIRSVEGDPVGVGERA